MATNNAVNNNGALIDKCFYGLNLPWALNVGPIGDTSSTFLTVPLILPVKITITKLIFEVTTLSVGSLANFAIYSSDGNTLLMSSGTQSLTTTGVKIITLASPVTIDAGCYLFGLWDDSGGVAEARMFTSIGGYAPIVNAFANSWGVATNAYSAGFPSSTGAISNAGFSPTAVLFSTE